MKRRILPGILVCSILAWTNPGQALDHQRPLYVPGQIIVKLQPWVGDHAAAAILAGVQGREVRQLSLIEALLVRVPAGTVEQAAERLRALTEVAWAEPNYLRYPSAAPNDPVFPALWGLNNTGQTGGTPDADIDAPEAWDMATGSPEMVVAVIDSGADLQHEDLAANIWTNPGEIPGNGIDDDGNGYVDDVHGWDFARNDNDPSDTEAACAGHGSHTSGTIGAVGNNGVGVTGVNWNVKIMPLKAFRNYLLVLCSASSADLIEAVEYATMMGVRVSNNSYGSTAFSQAEFEAIRASRSVFVAAAGNSGVNTDISPQYPSAYDLDNIISVAATDHNDTLASFSNYGVATVDLGAPGVGVTSTLPGHQYGAYDGTSMASPHVAGAAALILGRFPGLTDNEVIWRILNGTDTVGLPVGTGGRLNLFGSLTLPPPEVSIQVTPDGPTTVPTGASVPYTVTLSNRAASARTVDASVVAVLPDGRELLLESRTLTLPAGATVSGSFSQVIPPGAPAGEYLLSGRAEVAGSGFDEAIAFYTVTP